MRKAISIFLALTGLILISLPGIPAHAKSKEPATYQQGKLLDIQEKKDKTTTYTTTKQKDGSTVTTPTTSEQKQYFITVQVADLVYVGEYTPAFFGKPGDWIVGDPIEARFDNSHMILRKPNGKELKTKIKKRIRASEYQGKP